MRFLLLIFLLPLFSGATAQTTDYARSNWQFAFSVGGRVVDHGAVLGGISAADTLNRPTNRRFGNYLPIDTLQTDQGPVVYYNLFSFANDFRIQDPQYVPRLSISAHRRYQSGMEVGFGGYYSRYRRSPTLTTEDVAAEDFVYTQFNDRVWEAGLLANVVYNFRKRKRLQPYVGLQLDQGIRKTVLTSLTYQYPARGIVLEAPPIAPRFRESYIFDNAIDLIGGANYWLSDRWQLGIQLYVSQYTVVAPAALQLRYVVGGRETDDRR